MYYWNISTVKNRNQEVHLKKKLVHCDYRTCNWVVCGSR